MDIEFHYYITYFIALKAGFKPEDAYIIAYSSQYVDDNTVIYKVSQGTADAYNNYISQTMDITKPEKELMRIYPIFHFMPGDKMEIDFESAFRRDGKLHVLNTIPANSNARALLKIAFESKDLYRIGIATHTYADTFAHQNFIGYYESFNSMKGLLEKIIPDIGHADAKHTPDWPALVWEDRRLIRKNSTIDNKERFLIAVGQLFEEYRRYLDPGCPEDRLSQDKASVISDIEKAIGDYDKDNEENPNRIARYKALIGEDFKEYSKVAWFSEAVDKKGFNLKPIFRASYEWKANYQESNWFRFQQAVKEHQKFTKENILKPITENLELERW